MANDHARRPPGPAVPVQSVEALFAPTVGDALHTAGTLIHYITSTRDRMAEFGRWVEHCPGDLDDGTLIRALAAVHDRLCPDCPDVVTLPHV